MLMRRTSLPVCLSVVTLFSVLLAGPPRADAQTSDAIGIRAQGMGGAFTAVADDATATWWNPAGLAAGPYANVILEYGRPRDEEASHRGFAFAFPALGLSYYRLSVSEIRPISSTGASTAGRQGPGTGVVRSLELSQFG